MRRTSTHTLDRSKKRRRKIVALTKDEEEG
jgi:hypothetical protein